MFSAISLLEVIPYDSIKPLLKMYLEPFLNRLKGFLVYAIGEIEFYGSN